MTNQDELNDQLAAAAREFESSPATQGVLDSAIELAVHIVDGCDYAGMSILEHDGNINTSATDRTLRRADEAQITLNEGPCFDETRRHTIVHSADLANDPRWPRWAPTAASELGIRSMVAYQLFTTEHRVGVLNLYSRKLNGFDEEDIDSGYYLAAHLAVAVAESQDAEHLHTAIVNRTIIGQAEGILMERFTLTDTQAFAVLQRVSQNNNIKLYRVAAELVRTRKKPGI